MRRTLAVVAALIAVVCPPVSAAAAPAGFHVSGGRLYESNGAEFVMRGVNHAHTWYPQRTGALADIKALGANTVRVVLASGQRWAKNDTADVAAVVSSCKQNRLICVLEVHDTTGHGEQSGAATLAQAVDYWLSVRSALAGQEKYVIVNIGNEPYGNSGYQTWASDTSAAVQRLRAAGFGHTLMVDAPNWGQDWTFTMRDNAAAVFESDPDRNTVFSIHMYGVFDTAAEIDDYLGRFRAAGLPIVVGEFGHDHSDGNPDEDTILATTRAQGIGYLGWSWSGNGGGVEYLDMVTGFDPARLTAWGERIFNGADGIKATSREATVYGGTGPDPGGCAVGYRVTGQWQDGFQAEVTVTNRQATAIDGWRIRWTFPAGQRVTNMWHAVPSQTGADVVAADASYNARIPAGGSVTIGFTGSWTGGNPSPSAFVLNATSCAVLGQ
ncbi:cellulase family glycosylhydrolase [Amycolatopsis sp. EV170708-02-1]|uniref:cellulase family glycosylhydrolase n=1 Tax=Amycolatopsis sp. EV170708-02-1 TaxID=2919322 RepID=UPI001F0CAC26|nr:cellulase family glycosylhydrolase [Amycolatopsis sp. EV170708-02-1]UMP05582.1 cellulase family glycosylhydrolase [Amycolatopsis sp. EV170708-02-1]